MKTEKRKIGNRGEKLVAVYLMLRGWRIIERNYLVRGGEIDIIARRFGTTAFVEVKTRKAEHTDLYGRPADAVDKKKQEHLKYAAKAYISEQAKKRRLIKNLRFDVAEVYISGKKHKINYIEDAFR